MGDPDRLGMSKKRDHKIMVTEEAIRKVPFIRYREIPEDEYEIIYRLAKQVLRLSKDENESNEVSITYSFDPEKIILQEKLIAVQFGDEHSVNPMADTLSYYTTLQLL